MLSRSYPKEIGRKTHTRLTERATAAADEKVVKTQKSGWI